MREVFTTVLDLFGFALLTLAGFLVAVWLGFAIAGGAILYTSWKLARPKARA